MQLIKRAYGTDITPEEGQISPEEFEAEVAKLHPKRTEEFDDVSELTHIAEIPSLASLTSTPSNLHHTIGSLKKDSTPGWDGWTFDLIRQLYLNENQVGSEGALALGEASKINSTVTTLIFEVNQIGDEGAIALGEALKINSTVTILNLDYNQIGDEGAIALKG